MIHLPGSDPVSSLINTNVTTTKMQPSDLIQDIKKIEDYLKKLSTIGISGINIEMLYENDDTVPIENSFYNLTLPKIIGSSKKIDPRPRLSGESSFNKINKENKCFSKEAQSIKILNNTYPNSRKSNNKEKYYLPNSNVKTKNLHPSNEMLLQQKCDQIVKQFDRTFAKTQPHLNYYRKQYEMTAYRRFLEVDDDLKTMNLLKYLKTPRKLTVREIKSLNVNENFLDQALEMYFYSKCLSFQPKSLKNKD